jgi:hypothetical protein
LEAAGSPFENDMPEISKRGVAAVKANARRFAANVRPIIEEIMRGRGNEPQRHCGQAQRAQRSDSSGRDMDACAGGGNSAPFRRKRRRVKHGKR